MIHSLLHAEGIGSCDRGSPSNCMGQNSLYAIDIKSSSDARVSGCGAVSGLFRDCRMLGGGPLQSHRSSCPSAHRLAFTYLVSVTASSHICGPVDVADRRAVAKSGIGNQWQGHAVGHMTCGLVYGRWHRPGTRHVPANTPQ